MFVKRELVGREVTKNQNNHSFYLSPIEIKTNCDILYVQEVDTLQKKYIIYLHQKMRLTPFINYYNTLG